MLCKKTDINSSELIDLYNVKYKIHLNLPFDCKKVFWQQSTALTSLFVFPQLVDGCHREWKTDRLTYTYMHQQQ